MEPRTKGIFRDTGTVILRLEERGLVRRLDAGQFRKLAVTLLLLAGIAGLVTWGRVRVLANAYQIMELRTERDGLMADRRKLERRLEEMNSLNYAEIVARQRLGMVDVNPNRVITLQKRGAVGSMLDSVVDFFGSSKKGGR